MIDPFYFYRSPLEFGIIDNQWGSNHFVTMLSTRIPTLTWAVASARIIYKTLIKENQTRKHTLWWLRIWSNWMSHRDWIVSLYFAYNIVLKKIDIRDVNGPIQVDDSHLTNESKYLGPGHFMKNHEIDSIWGYKLIKLS